MKTYYITGTFHGSIVYARSEGDAKYNGESIIKVK